MCGIGVRVPGGQKQHHSGLQKRLHGLELPCDWEGGGWTSLVTTQLSDLGQDSGNRPRGCEDGALCPAELWGHLRSLPPGPRFMQQQSPGRWVASVGRRVHCLF